MPRYFFNIRHRAGPKGLAVDEEGDELPDVNAAREHALNAARDLITRHQMSMIRDWFVCSFEISDEEGRHVMTVPFSEVVPDENDEEGEGRAFRLL